MAKNQKPAEAAVPDTDESDEEENVQLTLPQKVVAAGLAKTDDEAAGLLSKLRDSIAKAIEGQSIGGIPCGGMANEAAEAIVTKIVRGQTLSKLGRNRLLKFLNSLRTDNVTIPVLVKGSGDLVIVPLVVFREALRVQAVGMSALIATQAPDGVYGMKPWSELVPPAGATQLTAWNVDYQTRVAEAAKAAPAPVAGKKSK